MKKLWVSAATVAVMCNVTAQTKTAAAPKKVAATATTSKPIFKNAIDSFSYAAGMSIGESLLQAGATSLNTQLVAKAMDDIMAKRKTAMSQDQANMTLQQKLQAFAQKRTEEQKQVCASFLEVNGKRKGVVSLPNGLQYEIIKAGDAAAAKPKAIDTVVVDYVGTLMDGKEFDNSLKRGAPATFPLNGVIKGWTEILQLMPVGSHWKVYIPSELGYGDNPPPGSPITPNALLIFEIILKDIKPAATATN